MSRRYTLKVPTVHDYNEENDTDLFAAIMEPFEGSEYCTKCYNALNARYEWRMVGHTEVQDYWVPVFKNRIKVSWNKWILKFAAFEAHKTDLGSDTDMTSTTTTHNENEDLPESVPATDDKYLSSRQNGTVTYTAASGKPSTTLREIQDALDDVGDPYDDWARTFDDLFLNRWSL